MSQRLAAVARVQHVPFLVVLAAGAAVRVLASVAYRPALFYSDSVDYLRYGRALGLSDWHPPGYSLLLHPLLAGRHLSVVPVVQHLAVCVAACVLYRMLVRRGCRPVLAALACAPLLLDAYQVQIEQYVLSDSMFEVLLIAVLCCALWSDSLSARRVATAGALLGCATLVRLDGVALVVPLLGWLLLRRAPRRALVAALVAFLLPVSALAMVRGVSGRGLSLSGMNSIWLYARVAPFADCTTVQVPSSEAGLCPPGPPSVRPGTSWFQNSPRSPVRQYLHTHPHGQRAVTDFATRMIKTEPLQYAAAVIGSYLDQFRPDRARIPGGPGVAAWQFPTTLAPADPSEPPAGLLVRQYGAGPARVHPAIARVLRDYQRVVFTPGPVLGVLLIVASALGARRRHLAGGAAALFVAGLGVAAVLWAAATVEFTWRYVLPTLVLVPVAAALSSHDPELPARRPGPGSLDVPDRGVLPAAR